MLSSSARNTIIRLTSFAALWVIAIGVRWMQRDDPQWLTKVGWTCVFAIPTVLLLWLMQRLARYRIPWLVELFGMPFAMGALVYAALGIRDIVGRP